jgi:hypothetical protein
MIAVGWKDKLRKCRSGYQYQYWVHIIMPTTADTRVAPDFDCIEITTFRPPASRIPDARMAPILVIVV